MRPWRAQVAITTRATRSCFGWVCDLVAAAADAQPVAVDRRIHRRAAVCESGGEACLALPLAGFPIAMCEVGEPLPLLLLPRVSVALGVLGECVPACPAEETVACELLPVPAQRRSVAEAARELVHVRLLPSAVHRDE